MISKSGKVAGRENAEKFELFIRARRKDGDWGQFISPDGRRLNRSALVKSPECKFAKSVFIQNPQVKARLARLEAELLAEGVLALQDWSLAGASGVTPAEALIALERQISNLGDGLNGFKKLLEEVTTKTAQYEAEAKVIVGARSSTSKRSR